MTLDNDEDKNACLKPTSITSELRDLADNFLIELENQGAWRRVPRIQRWIDQCRLNPAQEALTSIDPDDDVLRDILSRVLASVGPARENLRRLTARD